LKSANVLVGEMCKLAKPSLSRKLNFFLFGRGYINRWTMEITNNSRFYSIPLVVGRRVAQIVFFDSEGTLENRDYSQGGKYQTDKRDLEALQETWSPYDMLPKMYLDREIQ
jgi:uncharacterized protein YkuJ